MRLVAVMVIVWEQDKAENIWHVCRVLVSRTEGALFLWHTWVMPWFPVSVPVLQVMQTRVKHRGPNLSALSRWQSACSEATFSFLCWFLVWLVHFSLTAQKIGYFCGVQHVCCCTPSAASSLSSLCPDNLLTLLLLLDLRRGSYVGESREGLPCGEGI